MSVLTWHNRRLPLVVPSARLGLLRQLPGQSTTSRVDREQLGSHNTLWPPKWWRRTRGLAFASASESQLSVRQDDSCPLFYLTQSHEFQGDPTETPPSKRLPHCTGKCQLLRVTRRRPVGRGPWSRLPPGGAPTDRALIVQGVADLAGQVLVAIGLDEKANGAGRAKSGKQFWIGEARREHDANLRPSCACCPQEVDAIEVARHDDVAKNDVHDLLFK